MDKEKFEARIIDYIDGQLNTEERASLEKELASDADARLLYEQLRQVMEAIDRAQDFEPDRRMKMDFDKMLKAEIGPKSAKVIFFQPVFYRAAAAIVLVAAGIGIGYKINQVQRQENEIAAMKQEMLETKHMMMALLDNQQSASQRLVGTTVALNMIKADDEIVRVLVKTMNEDPNTNVRLAALDALVKFQNEPTVRKALIQSLSTQKDPMVQIALIRFMVQLKEKDIVNQLQDIADDIHTIKAVKDEAYSGILKLS